MNKILIVDAGLKHGSYILEPYLKRLHVYLEEEKQIVDVRNPMTFDERTFFSYNQIIFIFTSVIDCLPSSLLEIFEKLENCQKSHQEIYSIILCDEYEPEKCDISMRILKKWCEKENLNFKGSLNVGANLLIMSKRRFIIANMLKKFSKKVSHHEEVYYKVTYSSLKNFIKSGNKYWSKQIKKSRKN